MPESNKKSQISFRYKISQNYAVYAISGVHGGVNAQGDVIANLWSERAPIPRKQVYAITPEGRLGKQISTEVDESVIRDVIFAISLEPQTAKAIGEWLIEKAGDHQKMVDSALKEQKNG